MKLRGALRSFVLPALLFPIPYLFISFAKSPVLLPLGRVQPLGQTEPEALPEVVLALVVPAVAARQLYANLATNRTEYWYFYFFYELNIGTFIFSMSMI